MAADGSYATGYAAISPSARTLTVVGKINHGTYSVQGDRVRFMPDKGRPYDSPASCGGDDLLLNHLRKVRAPRWLASTLSGEAGGAFASATP